jgi:hypothetical protein
MKKMRNIVFVLTILAFSTTVFGHPGHGVTSGDSVAHITIDHFGLIGLVLAVVTALGFAIRLLIKKQKA